MEDRIPDRNTETIIHVFLAFIGFRHPVGRAWEKEGNFEKKREGLFTHCMMHCVDFCLVFKIECYFILKLSFQ